MKNNDVSPKVVAAGSGAALGTIIIWILGVFGVTVEPDVAAALATILATLGGWLARDVQRDKGTGNAPDVDTTARPVENSN